METRLRSIDMSDTGSFSHDGRHLQSYDQSRYADESSSTSQYHPRARPHIDLFPPPIQFGSEHVGESSSSSQSYPPQFINFFPPPRQLGENVGDLSQSYVPQPYPDFFPPQMQFRGNVGESSSSQSNPPQMQFGFREYDIPIPQIQLPYPVIVPSSDSFVPFGPRDTESETSSRGSRSHRRHRHHDVPVSLPPPAGWDEPQPA